MRKTILAGVAAVLLASGLAVGNVSMNKQHKGKAGVEGAKINCVYCHTKAEIPKKKGQDIAKLKQKAQCKGSGCHG